jgi:hypothetical protein
VRKEGLEVRNELARETITFKLVGGLAKQGEGVPEQANQV